MIAKKSRLPRTEFRSEAYRTVKTPFFSLKTKKMSAGTPKIGVVVGKSVHKNATKRNFWKRQAKQALAHAAKSLESDFLMILFPKAAELSRKQFQEEFKKAVRAAH